LHGVSLDVIHDTIELPFVAHVVVVRLILPERPPSAPQECICLPGGRPFHPFHENGWRNKRQGQHVNVVGHDHPCAKIVVPSVTVAFVHCFGDQPCNAVILEPERAGLPIESAIMRHERIARGAVNRQVPQRGERSVEPPREKKIAVVWVKVR
jgi:hypothetical protein